jgi:hypothetical protein
MRARSNEPTMEELTQLFNYVDGRLYWKKRGGKEAGAAGKRGYREPLNTGGTYIGPKTLHFDGNRKNTPQSVEGYFG